MAQSLETAGQVRSGRRAGTTQAVQGDRRRRTSRKRGHAPAKRGYPARAGRGRAESRAGAAIRLLQCGRGGVDECEKDGDSGRRRSRVRQREGRAVGEAGSCRQCGHGAGAGQRAGSRRRDCRTHYGKQRKRQNGKTSWRTRKHGTEGWRKSEGMQPNGVPERSRSWELGRNGVRQGGSGRRHRNDHRSRSGARDGTSDDAGHEAARTLSREVMPATRLCVSLQRDKGRDLFGLAHALNVFESLDTSLHRTFPVSASALRSRALQSPDAVYPPLRSVRSSVASPLRRRHENHSTAASRCPRSRPPASGLGLDDRCRSSCRSEPYGGRVLPDCLNPESHPARVRLPARAGVQRHEHGVQRYLPVSRRLLGSEHPKRLGVGRARPAPGALARSLALPGSEGRC